MQDGEPLWQGFEGLLALQPCQGCSKAVMDPRPKSHMRVRVTRDVKGLRIRKYLGIPICRGNKPPKAVVLPQGLAPQLPILRRNALDRFDGRIIAQALLRRPLGPAGWVLLELCPLLGMLEEGQGAIAQEVDGGLVAGQQQQGTVHQHLMPGEDPSFLTTGHYGNEIIPGML